MARAQFLRTAGLAVLALGVVACGDDPADTSSSGAGDTSALEAQLDQLESTAATAADAACTCLPTINSTDFPDKQTCLDDESLSADVFKACLLEALKSDAAAGTTFAGCVVATQNEATTCWQGCGTSLDDHHQNYDCHQKSNDAIEACFEGLSEAAQSAASDCYKGG